MPTPQTYMTAHSSGFTIEGKTAVLSIGHDARHLVAIAANESQLRALAETIAAARTALHALEIVDAPKEKTPA